MGMGFAPTWLRQVSLPLLHKTTLTTETQSGDEDDDTDGGDGVAAAGGRRRAGLTVRASSWPTRSTKAWTTASETGRRRYGPRTRPSAATD